MRVHLFYDGTEVGRDEGLATSGVCVCVYIYVCEGVCVLGGRGEGNPPEVMRPVVFVCVCVCPCALACMLRLCVCLSVRLHMCVLACIH